MPGTARRFSIAFVELGKTWRALPARSVGCRLWRNVRWLGFPGFSLANNLRSEAEVGRLLVEVAAVTFLFHRFRCSLPGAASMPLTRFLLVASPTRAPNFFFGKREKTLDSWYSAHIICGSFIFFVMRAGDLKKERMTVARKFHLEADAVAQHLPET